MTSLIGKHYDIEICLKQHNSTKGGLCNNRKWWQAKFILGYSTICFLIGLLYGLKILIFGGTLCQIKYEAGIFRMYEVLQY